MFLLFLSCCCCGLLLDARAPDGAPCFVSGAFTGLRSRGRRFRHAVGRFLGDCFLWRPPGPPRRSSTALARGDATAEVARHPHLGSDVSGLGAREDVASLSMPVSRGGGSSLRDRGPRSSPIVSLLSIWPVLEDGGPKSVGPGAGGGCSSSWARSPPALRRCSPSQMRSTDPRHARSLAGNQRAEANSSTKSATFRCSPSRMRSSGSRHEPLLPSIDSERSNVAPRPSNDSSPLPRIEQSPRC